jgi:aspartyl-tRNA(Asn)/glutamyl-tRNA(Gln) amidotransferase subunit A
VSERAGATAFLSLEAARQRPADELVEAALERIDALEERLNCFITVRRESARAEARAPRPGPLGGVPIAVKDNVATAGVPTTGASPFLADHVPTVDAPAWARLRDAGAILIGKTNMHELGMGPTGIDSHFGPTRNPWDPERVPGGSSGGSAAAVAVGMAYGALGTDAGGSVRIPAALCGVVGLKATHGLVPVRGGIAFGNPTIDHIGPLTRSVVDAALMLSVMAGTDEDDPTSCPAPGTCDFVAAARRGAQDPDLRGLTVGLPRDHYFEEVDPKVEAAVRAAIAQLERLGARLVDVRLPDHDALAAGMSGLGADALLYHARWMRERLHDYAEPIQVRLLSAQFVLGADYAKALRARRLFRERYDAALAAVDLLAAPTEPVVAPTFAEARDDRLDCGGKTVDTAILIRNTQPANRTGLPAITLPCGFVDGLPVGLMLTGRPFDEETILRAAAAYEATTEWHRARPPESVSS